MTLPRSFALSLSPRVQIDLIILFNFLLVLFSVMFHRLVSSGAAAAPRSSLYATLIKQGAVSISTATMRRSLNSRINRPSTIVGDSLVETFFPSSLTQQGHVHRGWFIPIVRRTFHASSMSLEEHKGKSSDKFFTVKNLKCINKAEGQLEGKEPNATAPSLPLAAADNSTSSVHPSREVGTEFTPTPQFNPNTNTDQSSNATEEATGGGDEMKGESGGNFWRRVKEVSAF